MSNAVLLPLVAALALGFAPALHAQAPKPLTENELLRTLDGLGKGDPVTKAPLSAEPETDQKSKKEKEAKPSKGETEITSEEGQFDQKTHQAVFSIKVFVKNPDFTLSCDKLTAYLKHDDTPKPKKAAGGNASPAASPSAAATARLSAPTIDANGQRITAPPGKAAAGSDKGGGLERAVAEGNVVITQDKVDDDGNVTRNVGRGKRAEYDSATGDVILKGKPEVQQGINTCVALDEGTVIILNRSGHMKTIGPTKNILRESGSADKSTNGR